MTFLYENYCLFYKQCIFCHGRCYSAESICPGCRADLPWPGSTCQRCALPLSLNSPALCADCIKHPPSFDQVYALLLYKFPIDHCIQRIKSSGQPGYLGHLAQLARQHFQDQPRPDCLIPIPMHWLSQQRRGFNQSSLLADCLGKLLNIPVHKDRLIKTTATEQQHRLSKAARQKNLKGVFQCQGNISSHVVLIDDVMTTGATLNEASRVLKQQGAQRVDAWVLARTP